MGIKHIFIVIALCTLLFGTSVVSEPRRYGDVGYGDGGYRDGAAQGSPRRPNNVQTDVYNKIRVNPVIVLPDGSKYHD